MPLWFSATKEVGKCFEESCASRSQFDWLIVRQMWLNDGADKIQASADLATYYCLICELGISTENIYWVLRYVVYSQTTCDSLTAYSQPSVILRAVCQSPIADAIHSCSGNHAPPHCEVTTHRSTRVQMRARNILRLLVFITLDWFGLSWVPFLWSNNLGKSWTAPSLPSVSRSVIHSSSVTSYTWAMRTPLTRLFIPLLSLHRSLVYEKCFVPLQVLECRPRKISTQEDTVPYDAALRSSLLQWLFMLFCLLCHCSRTTSRSLVWHLRRNCS